MTGPAAGTFSPDLLYRGGAFHRDARLAFDAGGRIVEDEPASERVPDTRLEGIALLPGFVNAHSHAFQRALRGRTSGSGADVDGSGGTFWTWRETMYRLVQRLDPDGIHEISLRAFREMAAVGFTTVGEFHYVHRDPDGRDYPDPGLLARRVIEAARDAGLRIRLLNAYYERAGLAGEPLEAAQRRFAVHDAAAAGESGAGADGVEAFLDRTRRLSEAFADDERVSVGVAPHSVRAVAPDSLARIFEAARGSGWPCHIHLSEQRSEVQECEAVYGLRPVELVADLGGLGPTTTGVHCTHVSDREIELLAKSGTRVCACPTTEADLGDGLLRAERLRAAGVALCLGTDSHARIDPFEEMRALEYHERLRLERRGVLGTIGAAREGASGVARELLTAGTEAGAASLALAAGALEADHWADFVGIDLEHPVLAGWSDDTLPEYLALAADPRVVTGVYVAGRRVA